MLEVILENIEMIWKPASDPWLVRIDPDQVDRILANLVIDSRDAISTAAIRSWRPREDDRIIPSSEPGQ